MYAPGGWYQHRAYSPLRRQVPLLGVCLGHQAIGAAFGGKVVRAPNLMHGKTSSVEHDGKTIFRNVPSPMTATRYRSLIVQEKGLPAELEISATCRDRDGTRVIMGLRHRKFPSKASSSIRKACSPTRANNWFVTSWRCDSYRQLPALTVYSDVQKFPVSSFKFRGEGPRPQLESDTGNSKPTLWLTS